MSQYSLLLHERPADSTAMSPEEIARGAPSCLERRPASV
jgi:hypothetical protein